MNKDNTLIPQHRFPEFNNDGSWDKLKVEEIIVNESSSLSINKLEFLNNGYKLFGADGLVGYIDYCKQEEDYIAIVKDGSGAGRLSYYPAYSSVVGTLTYLKIKDKKLNDLKFQYYNLHNIDFKNHIKGGGIPHIYYSDYKNDFIGNPTNLAEQQKIAACLSSLDDVIAGHEEKLTALEEHKKGLMQNLFPQEGATQPKYRFPEFKNDGDWVESNVGMNCKVKGRIGYRGYTTDDLVGPNEGAIVIGGKHIQDNRIELSDPTFLSWDKYYESPEIMVELNDIVFSQRGTLGDCAIIDKEIGKATINPSMVLLKEITCNKKFLYYILISDIIQNEVKKFKTLAAIPMLSQKQINGFKFFIPIKPAEQQKIVSVLSSVDELIVAQREKIEALKDHKKGLMQGLFPKIES